MVAATNVYDPPPAFTTAHCPPQIEPDQSDEYCLPEPAQAPDGTVAGCNCLSKRQNAAAQCEAVDGGTLGEYLQDLLERALEDSGDELSCAGTREVRTPHSSATPPPRLTCVGGAQNATKRYDAYREVARKLRYFDREPLPLCVVATIRSIFPSQHGTYVGYRGPH